MYNIPMVDMSIPSLSPNRKKAHKPAKLLLLMVILAVISVGLMALMGAQRQVAQKSRTSPIIQARQAMLLETSPQTRLSSTEVMRGRSIIGQSDPSGSPMSSEQLQAYQAMLK